MSTFPLPPDLPRPIDDGAANHLVGMTMGRIRLQSTADQLVDLAALGDKRTVIYIYPRTGVPGIPLLDGWDLIPGARGCTPQSCGFRDHHRELAELGAQSSASAPRPRNIKARWRPVSNSHSKF